MKQSGKSRRFRGLTQAAAVMTALAVGVTGIASEWSHQINVALGTKTYEVVSGGDENQDTTYYKSNYSSAEELIEAREKLIRETVAEGTVLLKNEEAALPLSSDAKISLFGVSTVHACYSASAGGASFDETLATKIFDACTEVGFSVNPVLNAFYEKLGAEQTEVGVNAWTGEPEMDYTWKNRSDSLGEIPLEQYTAEIRDSYKDYNDAAVVVISRSTGEGIDFTSEPLSAEKGGDGVHNILQLSETEKELIAEAKANFEKVIVYVNSDNMVEIEELKQDTGVDAIIWTGGVGKTGMYGVADVLCGNANPSGRLPDTMAVSNVSAPSVTNFGAFNYDSALLEGDNYTHYVVYAEGIYVGYRYYETRYEDLVMGQGNAAAKEGASQGNTWNYADEVTYGFGEGLSYTTFESSLDDVSMNLEDRTGIAKVTVTNTGNVAGMYPVQIYAQAPYTKYDKENHVEKASVQLLGYNKTSLLEPGESETIEVELNLRYLASYDYMTAKTYILDAGTYYITSGNGAHEALNNILAVKGYTEADGMSADGNAELVKEWTLDELMLIPESVTGEKVTNQLAESDLNYWLPDTVTYLSRSDWEGTWPKAYENVEPTSEMVDRMNTKDEYDATYAPDISITLDEMTTGVKNGLTLMSLYDVREDYDNELWDSLLDQMTLDEYAYCIYTLTPNVESVGLPSNNNVDGPAGLNAGFNTDSSKVYYVDEKTASKEVLEYRFNTFPSCPTRAASYNPKLGERIGQMMGEDGLWSNNCGITGPGCNMHRTVFNGRNNEYFSEDPVLTTEQAAKEIKAMREMGLSGAPKHFAFNDQEKFRQGLSCYFNEQAAREIYLRAFEGAVVEGSPLYLMSSFSRLGTEPATSSKELLTTILREEWGFKGFTMTDMAHDYMPIAASVVAGTDQWCTFSNERYLPYLNETELKANPELAWAAREAAHRMMYMTLNSNIINGMSSDSQIVPIQPRWQKALTGVCVTMGVLTVAALVLYVMSMLQDKKKKQ